MECQVGGLQKKPYQKIIVVDLSVATFEFCIGFHVYMKGSDNIQITNYYD